MSSAGPPVDLTSPRQWARQNLFNSWLNSVLTVVLLTGSTWAVYRVTRFVFSSADWEIVRRNLRLFMVGRFPTDELWRLWAALYLLAAATGLLAGVVRRAALDDLDASDGAGPPERRRADLVRFWPVVAAIVAVLVHTRTVTPSLFTAGAAVVLVGSLTVGSRAPRTTSRRVWGAAVALGFAAVAIVVAFDGVGWDRWGGLHLTLVVTVLGIAAAFPIGLLLALARRSSLPVLRWLAIAYIELFRGVPLITLLLMGQFVIFFLVPTYLDPPGLLVRALIAIVVFESAYLAEVVRGGLQSVPRGQYEAAQAIGLGPAKQMRLVILPQALRAVIPAIVGQFISLYKDTSLLSIIALLEVLRVAQIVTTQPDFLGRGLDAVTLTFVGFLYWAGCYTMSRESRRIERRLGVGTR